MNRDQAFELPIGTRVRGKLYVDGRWSYGEVVELPYYGKGVRFEDYIYIGSGSDYHGFYNISGRLLESLEVAT